MGEVVEFPDKGVPHKDNEDMHTVAVWLYQIGLVGEWIPALQPPAVLIKHLASVIASAEGTTHSEAMDYIASEAGWEC